MEIKQTYIIDGKEFEGKEDAEYYEKLCEAKSNYYKAAKEYEDLLNQCSCSDLIFQGEVMRDCGEQYQDEFDIWHQKPILIKQYKCKCCGKDWSCGKFNGSTLDTWKHNGKILVKIGTF